MTHNRPFWSRLPSGVVGGALLVSIAVLASSALLSLPGWVSGFAGVLASAATMRLMGLARPAALQASHIEAPELRGTERDVPEHEMLEPAVAAAPTAPSVQDATAQQHAERQLGHVQRMEAASHLASGVAHDLNNKLVVVGANIDAVVKHLKDQPRLRRNLLAALVASDQAAALMSKLLAFLGQREGGPQYLDVTARLESSVEFLERSLLSSSVTVELAVPEELWAVRSDPDELEATLVNLALNARDAMADGGTIAISARNTQVWQGRVPGLAPGDYVQISVHDTGGGIPSEHLDSVFDPFFTTKQAARASGLGLSQVRAYVERCGGGVEIDSKVGGGTKVSIFLPRSELSARVGHAPVAEDLVEDEDLASGAAEILIVDDEVEVALAMQAMLEELGYSTRIAIGSEEARQALRARRPDLVLTDVTMPGHVGGLGLGREIRGRYPDLPVVLITGNPRVLAESNEFPIVQKPIVSRNLHVAIQRQLEAAASPSNVVSLNPDRRRSAF